MTERDRLASPRAGTGNQRFLSLKQRENAAIWHHRIGRLWLFCENGIRGGMAWLSKICIFEHGCLRLADRRSARVLVFRFVDALFASLQRACDLRAISAGFT